MIAQSTAFFSHARQCLQATFSVIGTAINLGFYRLSSLVMHNRQDNGPPDLDEVFREWKRKLDQLMGELGGSKKPRRQNNDNPGGGNNHEGPPLGSGRAFGHLVAIVVSVIFGLVVIIWLLTGFYIVDSNERAVIMQFGRFTTIAEPGLHWRLPYPFEAHERVNFSNVRTIEIGGNTRAGASGNQASGVQMLTGDENVILVHYTVQYDVRSADMFILNDVLPDATARLAAETAMREVVGSSTLDKVLYEDREVVATKTREIIQEMLDRYAVGVRVIRVNLQSVRPPEQVQAAFDDAIKASQDRQRQVNEGEAYAQDVVPKARGSAARLIEEAQGYRESVIARAEGEASRFRKVYDEYKNAQEVTRERLYYDAVGDVYARSRKIVIDPESKSLINLSSPSNVSPPSPSPATVVPMVVDDNRNKAPSRSSSTATPNASERLNNRNR